MKITAAMAILAVVAVQAVAVPEAHPAAAAAPAAEAGQKWRCGVPGQACGKAKRDAVAEPWRKWRCGVPGQACGRKRSAEPNPEAEARRRRFWFCGVPGQACGRKRSIEFGGFEGETPEENEVGNEVGFCGTPGQPCAMVKRTANAIAEAVAEADPRRRFWFCGVPGQACGKARDLIDTVANHAGDIYGAVYEQETEELAASESDDIEKRDAEADPEARRRKWRCGVPGQACGKVKRDADAAPAAEAGQKWRCGVPGQACGRKRDADPEARRKWFCGVPGQACGKVKRDADADPEAGRKWFCGVPGQACGKKRDPEAVAAAIHSVDPSIFKQVCFEQGGECDTLLKIQRAFAAAKKAAAEEALIEDPAQKLAHCGGKNECTALTHAHQFAAKHGARSAAEEEEKCNGPEGLCTLARRDLEGLEETINKAVEAITAMDEE